MIRSLLIALAIVAPVCAQGRDDQYIPPRPPQFGGAAYGLILSATADNDSLLNRVRLLDKPVSTGLVTAEPPDEALIDLEAWLREPIPEDQAALRRVGFRRPPRGTVWQEDFTLPDDEVLVRDFERLRPTVDNMQGIWRVTTMTLDGRDLLPEEFAGLKYLVQGRVIFQSETSEVYPRPAPAIPTKRGETTIVKVPGKEPGALDEFIEVAGEEVDRVGPAGVSRPAPSVQREDPRQEEGVRLDMRYRADGNTAVYWWDRDADVVDPHLSRNRPSLRVSWPVRGGISLSEGMLVLGARGVGLRAILPTRFHRRFRPPSPPPFEEGTVLENERTVLLVMVRDEELDNRTTEVTSGEAVEYLEPGEPGSRTRINIIPQMQRVAIGGAPRALVSAPKRNVIPQIHRVPLAADSVTLVSARKR